MKTEDELKIKIRMILVDYHRRGDYDLTEAENDMLGLLQEPPLTDEDIERWAECYLDVRPYMSKPMTLKDVLITILKAYKNGTIAEWCKLNNK